MGGGVVFGVGDSCETAIVAWYFAGIILDGHAIMSWFAVRHLDLLFREL